MNYQSLGQCMKFSRVHYNIYRLLGHESVHGETIQDWDIETVKIAGQRIDLIPFSELDEMPEPLGHRRASASTDQRKAEGEPPLAIWAILNRERAEDVWIDFGFGTTFCTFCPKSWFTTAPWQLRARFRQISPNNNSISIHRRKQS